MLLPRCCSLLLALVPFASLAGADDHDHGHESSAHEHGVGQLDIGFDGDRLEIAFTAPGSDIVGFEGQPADAADAARVEAALLVLDDPPRLFAFEPADACRPSHPADVEAPDDALQGLARSARPTVVPAPAATRDAPHDEHADGSDHDHEHEHAADDAASRAHGDWSASYRFDCTKPVAMIINLFDAFPSLLEVRTQAIVGSAQTGVDLTPSARRVLLGGTR